MDLRMLVLSNKYKSVGDHKQLPCLSFQSLRPHLAISTREFFLSRFQELLSGCAIPPSPIAPANRGTFLDDISNRASPRLQRPSTNTQPSTQPGQPHFPYPFKSLHQLYVQLPARNEVIRPPVTYRCYGPGATADPTAAPADDPGQHPRRS